MDIMNGLLRHKGFEDGVDFVYDHDIESFSKPLREWLLREKADIYDFIEKEMSKRGYRPGPIPWAEAFSFW